MPKLCPVSPALLPQYAPGAEAAASLLPSFFRFHMALALARNETVIKQQALLFWTTQLGARFAAGCSGRVAFYCTDFRRKASSLCSSRLD